MATVKLTRSLRWHIINKLSSEFTARRYKVEREISATSVIQPLYNSAVSEQEQAAVEQLGTRWLNYGDRAIVKIKTKEGNTYSWWTNFEKRPLPHGFSDGVPPNVLYPGMVGYDAIEVLVDLRASIIAEGETLGKTIANLLENATTLNKVQALWPSVIEYCNQYTIQQLNAPVVKQTRAKPPVLELPDEAKATLIKLNLTRQTK